MGMKNRIKGEKDLRLTLEDIEANENEIDNISKKLHSLHIKFIDDDITPQDYKELKSSLETRKNDLVSKHLTINKMDREFSKYTTYGLSLLKNISGYYKQALGEVKSKIIGSIFRKT